MKKNKNIEDYNFYLMEQEENEVNKKLKKEQRNREKRIKQYNEEKEDNTFDFDTETVNAIKL